MTYTVSGGALNCTQSVVVIAKQPVSYRQLSTIRKSATLPGDPIDVCCELRIELEQYWHWVIGYWAIFADIGYYCYWAIFFSFWHPIRYRSDSSLHRPHDNHLDICGAAIVSRRRQRRGKVQAIQWSAHLIDGRKRGRYSVIYISLQINTLLCYTLVSLLVLSTGIARCQYYWILDTGCLAWYRSNPSYVG